MITIDSLARSLAAIIENARESERAVTAQERVKWMGACRAGAEALVKEFATDEAHRMSVIINSAFRTWEARPDHEVQREGATPA